DYVRVGGRRVQTEDVVAVTCRGHNHDARLPRLLRRVSERIGDVAHVQLGAEREVEHADVEAVAVTMHDHPAHGEQKLAEVGGAIVRGGLHGHETGVRRHTAETGGGVVPHHDAGEVRAMAVGVQALGRRIVRLRCEVRTDVDLGGRVETGHRDNARVDQRYVDALAGHALRGQL